MHTSQVEFSVVSIDISSWCSDFWILTRQFSLKHEHSCIINSSYIIKSRDGQLAAHGLYVVCGWLLSMSFFFCLKKDFLFPKFQDKLMCLICLKMLFALNDFSKSCYCNTLHKYEKFTEVRSTLKTIILSEPQPCKSLDSRCLMLVHVSSVRMCFKLASVFTFIKQEYDCKCMCIYSRLTL